jgi:hypothetical protein
MSSKQNIYNKESMMDELELAELSNKVDDFLISEVERYKISPLMLSAVVNARLYLFNEISGSEENFKILLDTLQEFESVEKSTLH